MFIAPFPEAKQDAPQQALKKKYSGSDEHLVQFLVGTAFSGTSRSTLAKQMSSFVHFDVQHVAPTKRPAFKAKAESAKPVSVAVAKPQQTSNRTSSVQIVLGTALFGMILADLLMAGMSPDSRIALAAAGGLIAALAAVFLVVRSGK